MKQALAILTLFIVATPASASGGADPFAGSIYQAVAAAVVFIVVYVVLKKAAWSKIIQGLQDRENRIKGDLESAERAAAEAQQTLDEYKQRLASANEEVKKVIDQGRTDAQNIASQMKQQTQNEIGQMRSRAEADISSAKQQALNDIYAQTATMATEVAGRILKRQISAEDHQQLVQDALGEMGKRVKN